MGARGCHVIGTSIFVQQSRALRLCQCSIFVQLCKALRTVLLKGKGNVTPPVLTPFALNVYDVYIVINHGVEL